MDTTENSAQKMDVGEAVATLVSGLPKPLQDFVTSTERETITLQLIQKYNLHVDQAGSFERAFAFMLLGLYAPDQFVQELKSDGLGEDTIHGLAKDLNEMVFIKLRNQEQTIPYRPAPTVVAPPSPPPQPYIPPRVVVAPTPIAPSLILTPPTPPSAPVLTHTPAYIPPVPVLPNPPPVPIPMPSVSEFERPIIPEHSSATLQYDPNIVPAHLQPARTMAGDIAIAQSGGGPSMHAPAMVSPIQQVTISTPPELIRPSLRPLAQQSPQPQLPRRHSIPRPSPIATAATPSSGNRDALHAVLKEYGIDPYRETPE